MPSKHRKLMFIAFSLHARPCANRKCLYWLSYIILTSALGRDHYHLHSPPPPRWTEFLKFLQVLPWLPSAWMKSTLLPTPPFQHHTTFLPTWPGFWWTESASPTSSAKATVFPHPHSLTPTFLQAQFKCCFSPKMGKYQGGKWGAQGTKLKEPSLPGASCALARKGSFNLPNMPHPRPSPAPIVPLPSPQELPVLWNSHSFAWWILSLVCVTEAGFDSCNECPSSFFLCSQFQNQQGARLSHMQTSSCSPPALFCLLP